MFQLIRKKKNNVSKMPNFFVDEGAAGQTRPHSQQLDVVEGVVVEEGHHKRG